MPRFFCPAPLVTGLALSLPAGAARHVQVLRLQPGDVITLFNGEGGEFDATVTRMGRSDVEVEVGVHRAVEREASRAVHLLAGITANERMDWLVEKATELGVASITPLVAERSVLKLKGERAEKKLAHWQGVAVAAAEQCGRNRVPVIHPAVTLSEWLKKAEAGERWVLSLSEGTRPLSEMAGTDAVTVLSGPEGGLSPAEEAAALVAGFAPVTLGPRVLRAETAPLAVLAVCA
ncbi:16S rRNA (uracil(1498)-N(3))-methyltransferase [Limnohabitans sp. Hippo3]|uniref:16S rRNA (uracil(1498)-N(3))-methyltransferase n=1 Tax=Limnohabitans sp. Hippo3 TaxID=1597956 RepID=UPI000D3C7143|nr:16S rRNA (uracil(1498)-N(3))-methyltransferase [Limnohabitans sp. Hippo3]PUE38799.1 16S rRNA (uracil(1498)-N(3))-methyltransferase [Limnohabitans sp. Hippo3]